MREIIEFDAMDFDLSDVSVEIVLDKENELYEFRKDGKMLFSGDICYLRQVFKQTIKIMDIEGDKSNGN